MSSFLYITAFSASSSSGTIMSRLYISSNAASLETSNCQLLEGLFLKTTRPCISSITSDPPFLCRNLSIFTYTHSASWKTLFWLIPYLPCVLSQEFWRQLLWAWSWQLKRLLSLLITLLSFKVNVLIYPPAASITDDDVMERNLAQI